MGRPQKISFQCQYCDKIFKRKNNYEIHLQSHSNISGEKRKARVRSNWCYVCRQSFTSAEYKIHIMNEHQFDSHLRLIDDVSEIKNDEDIDTEIFKEKGNLSPKKKIKQEVDRISKGKSPRKTDLKLSKNLRTEAACSSIKIKSEQDNETLVIPRKRGRKPKMRSPPTICDICGLECKNERGIKIHKSTIHKRNSPSKKPNTTPEHKKIESDQLKEVLPEPTSQHINSGMPSTNSQQLYFQVPLSGLGQNAQSQLIYNPFPIQTNQKINSLHTKNETSHTDVKVQCYQPKPQQTNQYINYVTPSTNNQQLYVQGHLLNQNTQPQLICNPYPVQQPIFMNNSGGIVNQPNKPDTQMAPIFMNQNPEIEHIPTFSPDDEKYIKWLKNFVYKCKLHRYPLTPMLCKSLNHLHFEIADAMANPTGSMLRRSKQFYFKKIQTVISEIMLGQLRQSIHVVKR